MLFPDNDFKSNEMKKLTCIFALLLFSLSICGQKTDYIAEMLANHHGIMQREGTEQQLKELLGPYGEGCDEVFAILFIPQFCPRCEVDIPYFIHQMPQIKPGARVVLIAAYPEADLARKYVKQKFGFDQLIVDTKNLHEQIFRYRTGRLAVTYVLQIDAKQGRLMCGGDTPTMSKEFLQQLADNTQYMPMFRQEATLTSPTTVGLKPQGTYPAVRIDLGNDADISGVVELPAWAGDTFLYSDELLSAGLLFEIKSDSIAQLQKRIVPTDRQERAFVEIPDSVYKDMKDDGQIFIMANGCSLDSETGTAIVSYSLPQLTYKDKETIAYYNQAVLLQTPLSASADTCTMLPLDLLHENENPLYFYTSTTHIIPIGDGRLMLGCLTGYPVTMTAEETKAAPERDIFQSRFYTEAPICAIFDMHTGKLLKRFGQLDSIFQKTHTGYYYTMPTGDCDGRELVYTDGCSGKVWLTDKNADRQGREFTLFDVPVTDSLLLAAKHDMYTDEHFNHFLGTFHRYIDELRLDEQGIHCLIRHGKSPMKEATDIFEYRVLTREGHEIYSAFLQLEDTDKPLAFALGKDKNGHIFPYYLCRNGKHSYLKRCTVSLR